MSCRLPRRLVFKTQSFSAHGQNLFGFQLGISTSASRRRTNMDPRKLGFLALLALACLIIRPSLAAEDEETQGKVLALNKSYRNGLFRKVSLKGQNLSLSSSFLAKLYPPARAFIITKPILGLMRKASAQDYQNKGLARRFQLHI